VGEHTVGHLPDADRRAPDPTLVELREANERLVIAGLRMQQTADLAERRQREAEAATVEAMALQRLGRSFSQELDHHKLVQLIADEATASCGANFGALFFNVTDAGGDAFARYVLSGAPKEAFADFPMPRATPILAPTFRGERVVRIADVRNHPRYGAWGPQPEGHLPVVSYLAVPIISRSGSVLGGLFFAHREPDQFSLRHERVLVGLAALAAIALDNARLYEALTQTNRIKDEFLATLSHELRTPLSAILGWAHLLGAGVQLPAARRLQAVDAIKRNARAQAQLIDDLLDVSRIISGKLPIDAQPTSLGPVVEAALDTVRLSAAAKGVELRAAIDPHTSFVVNADAGRLQQIVWNLLSNAVKFTGAGGRVDVELRQANDAVEIVVSDTGVGIAASVLPHVFERFWQSDSRPARRPGGLGLGLAIVRHLCEVQGATVTAASAGVDRGAVFTVRLPLESSGPRDAQSPSALRTDVAALTNRHVLVVDDDADARFLTSQILAAHGAEVASAGSTRDALHAMRMRRFDAIVADIGMPGEDGYELIKAVRSLPAEAGGRIPAIALTAYASLTDRDQALAAGFTSHVPKPVEPQELAAAIAGVIPSRGID
jgi:signal transduction histidine kinase/ActR/RegA family two-component response regulator